MMPGKRRVLLWGMVVIGLFLPVLPRLIVPIIAPGRTYMDTIEALFRTPAFAIGLCLWTALPFVTLALAAKSHLALSNLDPTERFLRTAGIIGSFVFGLVTGFIIHTPQTTAGVNFGIILFPIYTLVIMPVGYLVGRMIGWVIHNVTPNVGLCSYWGFI